MGAARPAARTRSCGEPYGMALPASLRREVGGTPVEKPSAYAARSPLAQHARIAESGVRLQIWWSTWDRIVRDQRHQSYALFRELRRLNPCAPISAYVGIWTHSKEMRASSFLPVVLSGFDLLPGDARSFPPSVRSTGFPSCE